MAAHYDEYSRLDVPALPIERRTGVAEVETGYTEAAGANRGQSLPAVLDQHDLRRERSEWHGMHSLRRVRGCVPGELPVAGAAEGVLRLPKKKKSA